MHLTELLWPAPAKPIGIASVKFMRDTGRTMLAVRPKDHPPTGNRRTAEP